MKEYLLLFRSDSAERSALSPAELEANMSRWAKWISGIAEKEMMVGAQPLEREGKVVRGPSKKLTDGPFMEGKEVLGGYVLLKANSYDEAVAIANGCPILEHESGTVEVREVGTMEGH
jgi:hypothetical protein